MHVLFSTFLFYFTIFYIYFLFFCCFFFTLPFFSLLVPFLNDILFYSHSSKRFSSVSSSYSLCRYYLFISSHSVYFLSVIYFVFHLQPSAVRHVICKCTALQMCVLLTSVQNNRTQKN